jgi:hypothetical protein
MKTTQLILFGMLLGRAQHGRAQATRGAAASRRELGGAAHGDAACRRDRRAVGRQQRQALLKGLRDKEQGGNHDRFRRAGADRRAVARCGAGRSPRIIRRRRKATWIAKDFRFHTGEGDAEREAALHTVGAPTGEPVLILHGTGGSAANS